MPANCWICGKPASKNIKVSFDVELQDYITSEMLIDNTAPTEYRMRCYCDKCVKEVQDQHAREMTEYIRLKKRMMFYKAVDMLEKQNVKIYQYKEAIDVVEDHIKQHPDKFDSSYEALAAIILVQNRIYSKMQYKIGKYQVDFLLPELKTVLEIDGDRHKYRKGYDGRRDEKIKHDLGKGWEVVRIKTEYLDQKAERLPDAIYKVLEYREQKQ